MNNTNICIVRPTYYDRSAMLQLSLEYQKDATNSQDFKTYIFVDPHPKHGIVPDYDKVITDEYTRINWPRNSGKYSWYDSVKYIFDNTNYEYVLTIEDDIIISKDYLKLCSILISDKIFEKNKDILFFHSGGLLDCRSNNKNINRIIKSKGVASRSILISKDNFQIVNNYVNNILFIDNDDLLQSVLNLYNMYIIMPDFGRDGHFGIYGWSASFFGQKSIDGKKSVLDPQLSHEELYSLLKQNCLSGEQLKELNKNKNPNYFWDFDPTINFTKLEYNL